MKNKRIGFWGTLILAAALLAIVSSWFENLPQIEELQTITVCAPADMESAFKYALTNSNLSKTHKIVMTDDPTNANICVDYQKQDDESYQKFAFSPFIIAYNDGSEYFEELEEAHVCLVSPYNDDYYEINFPRIIKEVIGEGKWSNLGIKDKNNIQVFYPDEDSIYWNDFHDFLLVTVNAGKYPDNVSEMQAAERIIQQFLNSKYTTGVSDFNEQVIRTGGFTANVMYVLPEKVAASICSNGRKYARFLYPITTVYFNYYFKGDEIGSQIIAAFGKNSFKKLRDYNYRNIAYSELGSISSYVYDERDVYNVVSIPKTNNIAMDPES